MSRRVASVVASLLAVVFLSGAIAAPSVHAARACAGASSSRPVVSESSPGITLLEVKVVDRNHSTSALAPRPAQPCRILPVEVHWPTGASGPLPVILVLHGADGEPSRLRPLIDAWAHEGYVVAAPTFLVTKKEASGKALPAEVARQAADARFVIDQVLGLSTARAPDANPLRGLIDTGDIGVAGMSLGGMTVYGLISHTCCRDGRFVPPS